MLHRSSKDNGFTLIEIGIIVPILIVCVLVLFDALFLLLKTSTIERSQTATIYDVQTALSTVEDDTALTSLFLPGLDSTVSDPYQPGGGWSYIGTGSNSRVLTLRAYSTTGNPLSTSRAPVYINSVGCDATNIYFNDVLQYNIVYFVSNGTLYRRRDLDTSQTTCTTQYQKQSCPSLETLGLGTRDSACQADDEVIATGVTNFSIQYFATKSATTAIDVYAVGADPALVTTAAAIEVDLTISRKAYGQNTPGSSQLRMTKLNVNAK